MEINATGKPPEEFVKGIGAKPSFVFAKHRTPEIDALIEDAFRYHPWNGVQSLQGSRVVDALIAAIRVIIENVPPSADRSAAIRKIREARMDRNSAITHDGAY